MESCLHQPDGMTHLSLFTGIGGLDLAAEWAGFKTSGQCEWADFPTKVLEQHWPLVPRWRDIRTLTKESFYEKTGLRTVNVVSGGFPCQPFSVAGKQKGKEDNRYLWPEMLRVVRELEPDFVIGENVPGIINIAADTICAELEREGYEVVIFDFEAAAVAAPHRRERVAFVAHAMRTRTVRPGESRKDGDWGGALFSNGVQAPSRAILGGNGRGEAMANAEHDGFTSSKITGSPSQRGDGSQAGSREPGEFAGCRGGSTGDQLLADAMRYGSAAGAADPQAGQEGESAKPFDGGAAPANADIEGPQGLRREHQLRKDAVEEIAARSGMWTIASRLGRMAYGISGWLDEPDIPRIGTGIRNRADRLKCLGNAVVPQQFYPIFRAIAIEIETQIQRRDPNASETD